MRVFQLLGPLYGQRDASYRRWESLPAWLESQGYERSKHDQCLFVNPTTHMRLAVHVDDLLARGSRKQTELFRTELNQTEDEPRTQEGWKTKMSSDPTRV